VGLLTSPVDAVKQLIRDVGLRHGVYTRSLRDSGVVVGDSEAIGHTFKRDVGDAIEALREEFGPTSDPDMGRANGVDPEVLLGPPPPSATDSDWMGFAAWTSTDSWIFIAARYYRVGDSSSAAKLSAALDAQG
jgi:hypothetical protein